MTATTTVQTPVLDQARAEAFGGEWSASSTTPAWR